LLLISPTHASGTIMVGNRWHGPSMRFYGCFLWTRRQPRMELRAPGTPVSGMPGPTAACHRGDRSQMNLFIPACLPGSKSLALRSLRNLAQNSLFRRQIGFSGQSGVYEFFGFNGMGAAAGAGLAGSFRTWKRPFLRPAAKVRAGPGPPPRSPSIPRCARPGSVAHRGFGGITVRSNREFLYHPAYQRPAGHGLGRKIRRFRGPL